MVSENEVTALKNSIVSMKSRIKFKDNFHLKNTYYMMYDWLCKENWATRKDNDFPEVFVGQNEAALGGVEAWWSWRPERVINSYIKWKMDIDTHIILIREVEVMKDGKKYKTNWGEIEIHMHAWVVPDWQGKWVKHPILKHFADVYMRRIQKATLTSERDQLRREAYRYREAIKEFLELNKNLPESESEANFFPRTGIGEE